MAVSLKEVAWTESPAFIEQRQRLEVELAAPSSVATFDQVLRYNTGRFMPPSAFAQSHRRRELLAEQTERMADALERNGIKARYETNLTQIHLVTGQTEAVTAYRNICFLPLQAQKNRRSQQNDLAYFMKNEVPARERRWWKYLVVTSGQRIPAFGDLGGAIREFNKVLAKLKRRVFDQWGVDLGFVGLEFPRDADGTYHLHANLLVKMPFFKGREYAEFHATVTETLENRVWHNAGTIENLDELIKYPFKPNDVADASDDELVWLFRETFKRRITRLRGPVAAFRRWRQDAGLRVFKMGPEYRLREVDRPFAEGERDELEIEEAGQEREAAGGSGENIILTRVAPSFKTLWAEPSVLVMNYNPEPNAKYKRAWKRLETITEWRADAYADWTAAGAPDPLVAVQMAQAAIDGGEDGTNVRALWHSGSYHLDNGTITLQDEEDDFGSVVDDDHDPPPKEPDDPCKVIQFPAKNIETEKTALAVEEDVCWAESYSEMLEAIFGSDDAVV